MAQRKRREAAPLNEQLEARIAAMRAELSKLKTQQQQLQQQANYQLGAIAGEIKRLETIIEALEKLLAGEDDAPPDDEEEGGE